MTNYQRTADWLRACGKMPSQRNLRVQLGCHLEEFAELLDSVFLDSARPEAHLRATVERIKHLADRLKIGDDLAVLITDREGFLDALCDCEVTGNGLAYLAGMNKVEADKRVLDSNDSKLENGVPVLLPGGKIGKGPNYKAPNLADLV